MAGASCSYRIPIRSSNSPISTARILILIIRDGTNKDGIDIDDDDDDDDGVDLIDDARLFLLLLLLLPRGVNIGAVVFDVDDDFVSSSSVAALAAASIIASIFLLDFRAILLLRS
jgi:hypothetical protein